MGEGFPAIPEYVRWGNLLRINVVEGYLCVTEGKHEWPL